MPNPDNLIPQTQRTTSERRINARKAGIASGKARRARKTLREELLTLLSTTKKDEHGNEQTMQELVSLGLIRKAIAGDPAAFKTIRETIGEDVAVKLDIQSKTDISFGNMNVDAIAAFVADVKERENE